MADEPTVKERKQKVRKLQKRYVRTTSKAEKAEARRQELKKKSKKVRKEIKSGDATKKEKEQLRERKSKLQDKRQDAKKTVKRTTAKATKIAERRDKARNYSTTQAGTPGVKNDVINPFWNSDQIAEMGQKQNDFLNTIDNLNYATKQAGIENDYNKAQVDKQKPYELEKVNNSAAGRGLFHSSIRDAGLYDIDATAAINKANYDRAFDTLRMEHERQAAQATTAFMQYKQAMNQAAVDNAAAASEGMELYKVDPTEAVTTQHTLDIPKVKQPGQNNNGGGQNNNGNPEHLGGQLGGQGASSNNPGGGPTGPRPNVRNGPNRPNRNGPPKNNPTPGRPNPNG